MVTLFDIIPVMLLPMNQPTMLITDCSKWSRCHTHSYYLDVITLILALNFKTAVYISLSPKKKKKKNSGEPKVMF